uniref:Uncharacterized protein n=1 Tax=Rocky Ridge virus TaxID=3139880 RepID=A0AAN0LXE2_9VIRU
MGENANAQAPVAPPVAPGQLAEAPVGFWNPRDTAFQRRKAFGGMVATDQLTGLHCDFLANASDDSIFPKIVIMARGEAYLKVMGDVEKGTLTMAIANAIAPSLGALALAPGPASLRGREQVVEFLRQETGRNVRDLCIITPQAWEAARAAGGPLNAVPWLGDYAGLLTLRRPDDGTDTVEHYVAILGFLLTYPTPKLSTMGTRMYATLYVSLAKQGNISRTKLEKINQDLSATMGFEVDMTEEAISYTYQQIGTKIPHNLLEVMFNTMRDQMQGLSLRMQVTLQQAAGTGLTGLQIIKRAVMEHPSFPWGKLAQMLPSEGPKVIAAFQAVGNDPFYGFLPDLGVAKSTNYARYVWVCQRLLRRFNAEDERTLRGYRGGVRGIPNQPLFEELIESYTPPEPGAEVGEAFVILGNDITALARACTALQS